MGVYHEEKHIFQEAQHVNDIRNLIVNQYEFITQTTLVQLDDTQK